MFGGAFAESGKAVESRDRVSAWEAEAGRDSLVTELDCVTVVDLDACKLLDCVVRPRPEDALPDAVGVCDVSTLVVRVRVEPEMLEALLDDATMLALSNCDAAAA